MDNHPSCRRLHKIPAHTFKDPGKRPQRRSRVLRSFLRSEPPIIAGFSASSTPFFQGRLTGVDVVADAASSLDPKVFRRCEPPIMAGLSALSTTCLRNLKLFVKLLPQVQVETRCLQKKENPAAHAAGFSGVNPGDDLLSHGLSHTTIGAAAFHFRVRDGIGWFHSANFTREAFGESHSSRRTRRQPRIVLVT